MAVPFESIRIRGEVAVIRLQGEAARLTARKQDRFPLKPGDTLPAGARFRLEAGAVMELRGEHDPAFILSGRERGQIYFLSFLDENELGHRLMK